MKSRGKLFSLSEYLTLHVVSFLILENEAFGKIHDIMCVQFLHWDKRARQTSGGCL